jgi:hypothetical protein
MASNNCHIQTGSCMLIGVPLNDSCQIVEGASVYTTAGVGSMTGEAERQEGTDYSATNFGGVECGPQQQGNTVERWLNLSGEFCLKDWAFMAATSGNPTVLDAGGNTVGYASLSGQQGGACDPVTKPRVALVVVRRAATSDGGCVTPTADTGATSCVAHFFPMTTDWLWDLPPFEDARALVPFTAKGYTNPLIGAGPLNLWPADYDPAQVPADAHHAEVFVDCASLPSVSCDEPLLHPEPRELVSA